MDHLFTKRNQKNRIQQQTCFPSGGKSFFAFRNESEVIPDVAEFCIKDGSRISIKFGELIESDSDIQI